jgi:hypothetical protein
MSIKWEQVQQNHYNKQKKKKSDPHIWATTIITSMWQGFLQMWEDRNNNQHGRDQNKAVVKERDTLLRKLKHFYVQKDILDPKDQRLYHKPVQEWEEATNKKIREWINLAELLTKPTKKTTRKKKVDPRQPLIQSYFTTQRNEGVPKNTRTYTSRPPRQNQNEE